MKNFSRKIYLSLFISISICLFVITQVFAVTLKTPSDLKIAEIDDRGALVSWDEVNGAVAYHLCLSKEKAATFEFSNVSNGTSHELTSLIAGQEYYVQIRACSTLQPLNISDCKNEITGCSEFSSVKKFETKKELNLEEEIKRYESKNLSLQEKLGKYKEYYVNKFDFLDDATGIAFEKEVNSVIASLESELTIVRALNNGYDVKDKYYALRKNERYDAVRYKLKIYSFLNSTFKRLNYYKERLDDSPNKEAFLKHLDDDTISSSWEFYKSLEKEAVDMDISSEEKIFNDAGDNVVEVFYKEVRNSKDWYNFSKIIYSKENYLIKVQNKLEQLREKVLGDERRDGYTMLLESTQEMFSADKEENIINEVMEAYDKDFTDTSVWNDLEKGYTSYKVYCNYSGNKKGKCPNTIGMTKYSGMKDLVNRIKILQLVDKILERVEYYQNDADKGIGSLENISTTLREKSVSLKDSIYDVMQDDNKKDGGRVFELSAINMDIGNELIDAMYDEIRNYSRYNYKVFSYFWKAVITLDGLVEDIHVAREILGDDNTECDDTDDICKEAWAEADKALKVSENLAEGSDSSAQSDLLKFDLDNYDEMKNIHYSSFKEKYTESKEKFKDALDKIEEYLDELYS